MILELAHCCVEKAANLGVDARLETRTGEVVDHRLNLITRHISTKPEDTAEDKGEVYNVASHEADILLAKEMLKPVLNYGKNVLTCSCSDCLTTELPSLVCHLI